VFVAFIDGSRKQAILAHFFWYIFFIHYFLPPYLSGYAFINWSHELAANISDFVNLENGRSAWPIDL